MKKKIPEYTFNDLDEYLDSLLEGKIVSEEYYVKVKKAIIKNIKFSILDMGFSSTEVAYLLVKGEKGKSIILNGYSAVRSLSYVPPTSNWAHLKLSKVGDEIEFIAYKNPQDTNHYLADIYNHTLKENENLIF